MTLGSSRRALHRNYRFDGFAATKPYAGARIGPRFGTGDAAPKQPA